MHVFYTCVSFTKIKRYYFSMFNDYSDVFQPLLGYFVCFFWLIAAEMTHKRKIRAATI